jgi:WD40 repeat protein
MAHRTLTSVGIGALAALVLAVGTALGASPSVLWSQPNPGMLQASTMAVAWAPNGSLVATGLNDRWVRIRSATNGAQVREILQPHRSGGVIRVLFSNDSQFLAVGNSSVTTQFRVYQVSTGGFLGLIVASVDAKGIVHYGVDAQLAGAPGGAGQLSMWRVADLPVSVTTGSGYDKVTTRFQLSPNGAHETAITKSTVTVRRVSDGATLATLTGQSAAFSANSGFLAVWKPSPNTTTLHRTSDYVAIRIINSPDSADHIGVSWTPSGLIVGAGYRPFVKPDGTWDQTGILRFWRPVDGVLLKRYDSGLDIAVTSNVTFTTDATKFAVGLYNGTTIAAIS